MATSILHRATGIVLALGLPVLAFWIASVAAGGELDAFTRMILGSWIGYLALIGWTFALSYHLMNGLRHLSFDAGLGWARTTVRRTGWAVIAAAALLTAAIWSVVFLA